MSGKRKCRCRFLVPVNYNDGRPVEPEFFIRMKTQLDQLFGGYRVVGTSEGCWQGQIEDTHEIEVVVFPKYVPTLKQLVTAIGRELGQQAMYFDAPDPSVEIIDTSSEEDDDDDDEDGDEDDDEEDE